MVFVPFFLSANNKVLIKYKLKSQLDVIALQRSTWDLHFKVFFVINQTNLNYYHFMYLFISKILHNFILWNYNFLILL